MSEPTPTEETMANSDSGWMSWFTAELTGSPVNCILLVAIVYLLYKIFKSDEVPGPSTPIEPPVPPMKKRDFTLKELKELGDGTSGEGRILVAVNGKVYDVTKGKRFYGPGGPYSCFAGRDASRGLATFSVSAINEEYDDLSDLKPSEMEQVREWELQFSEKYTYVGKLLKPGEQPTSYSDEEDDDEDDIEEIPRHDDVNKKDL
ncbi:membrane-associated progesterone receptor component 1-like [Tigriopus californicus]|uniref:membrane-associated progesterone receptor component 1-like n=1 Tax=Tigriopus californicus TaxID=6832 RepID=UPI0027DA7A10|nr:membrane-associated progesterone receptor component 1-like [Tigriopus californicus]